MKLLVFAGSAEARRWINHGRRRDYEQWVFVNTPFGKDLLPEEDENLKIFVGKKSKREIGSLLHEDSLAIIDGYHPFCELFSRDLKDLAEEKNIAYLRLLPDEKTPEGVEVVSNLKEAAACLESTSGNILVTTGLESIEELMSTKLHLRLYCHLDPIPETIQKAVDLGLGYKQILALCGPLSPDMHLALIHQYKIKVLLTGESILGEGVEEKVLAAKKAGIPLVVIRYTDENTFLVAEMEKKVDELAKAFLRRTPNV